MINELTLTIYIAGSIVFCWAASYMATQGGAAGTPEVKAPSAQAGTAAAVYLVLLALSTALRFFAPQAQGVSPAMVDVVFSGTVFFSVFAITAWYGDTPAGVGLSLRNAATVLLFLIPPAGLVLLPGGRVNATLLLGGIVPSIAAAGAAEELLFKGYLQTRFQAAWGVSRGLPAAALAAALFRIPMLLLSAGPAVALLHAALHFLLWGCVGGLIYNRIGNIYGLIVLRIFLDAAPLVFLGLTID